MESEVCACTEQEKRKHDVIPQKDGAPSVLLNSPCLRSKGKVRRARAKDIKIY